jgi:hypothetical protein
MGRGVNCMRQKLLMNPANCLTMLSSLYSNSACDTPWNEERWKEASRPDLFRGQPELGKVGKITGTS